MSLSRRNVSAGGLSVLAATSLGSAANAADGPVADTIIGRIYCTGTPEDYKAVHELQDQVQLFLRSSYGKVYAPPPNEVDLSIDMKTAVRDQLNAVDAVAYFTLLCELM